MKKFVIAGTLAAAVAVGATALAQQPAQTTPPAPAPKAKPAAPKTDAAAPAGQEKPAAPKKARAKKAEGEGGAAAHTAPKPQPETTGDPKAPAVSQPMTLGTVHIPMAVKADGKELPAGTYTVRLTPDEAKPDAKGASQTLERWVEFVKGGKVVGREVVSIVPADEAKLVQKDTPPPSGGSKVQKLKGGDYTRVWINKGGTYYLVHLANA
jgi:hypothetical protein